jgi:hypothetical protein
MTTLAASIYLIIPTRSPKEVVNIAARAIVAVVTNLEAFWYFALFN